MFFVRFLKISSVMLFLLLTLSACFDKKGSLKPLKIVCLGDSITYGHKLVDPTRQSYPAQLARLSRGQWRVMNSGVNGATVLNKGDGPAENITVEAELSDGLEISLGNEEKLINFLGSGENIRFQIFVRAVGQGDELVTMKVVDGRSGQEVVKTSMIRVG